MSPYLFFTDKRAVVAILSISDIMNNKAAYDSSAPILKCKDMIRTKVEFVNRLWKEEFIYVAFKYGWVQHNDVTDIFINRNVVLVINIIIF